MLHSSWSKGAEGHLYWPSRKTRLSGADWGDYEMSRPALPPLLFRTGRRLRVREGQMYRPYDSGPTAALIEGVDGTIRDVAIVPAM
jgi:hypothetical protein